MDKGESKIGIFGTIVGGVGGGWGVRGESIIIKSSQPTKNGYLGLIVIVCRTDCGNSCVYRTCR